MQKAICHDCTAEEGQIYEYGCDMERCPFCGQQLISCDCCYRMLGLFNKRYGSDTYHLPPDIYENGLTKELEAVWLTILNARGRIPFIEYPTICAKCGKLWADLFRVSDEEWEHYVQPDQRHSVLCRECYDFIRGVVNDMVGGIHAKQPECMKPNLFERKDE